MLGGECSGSWEWGLGREQSSKIIGQLAIQRVCGKKGIWFTKGRELQALGDGPGEMTEWKTGKIEARGLINRLEDESGFT